MARPGAVVEVDRNSPPTLFHYGEGFRLERLPLGSRILYPADPLDRSRIPSGRSGEPSATRSRTTR